MDPAGHLVHDWRSISYLPAGHESHFEAPEDSETLPGSHSKQKLLAAGEYDPEPHFVQKRTFLTWTAGPILFFGSSGANATCTGASTIHVTAIEMGLAGCEGMKMIKKV